MWRYHPGINRMLKAARSGWLGDIHLVQAAMHKTLRDDARVQWVQFRGGQMFELGPHVIDPLVRLLGRPNRVTPYLKKHGEFDDTLADNTIAVFEYSGALGLVTGAALAANGSRYRSFEIHGTNGVATLRPIEDPHLVLNLAEPAGPYPQGLHEVALPRYERYVDDMVALAAGGCPRRRTAPRLVRRGHHRPGSTDCGVRHVGRLALPGNMCVDQTKMRITSPKARFSRTLGRLGILPGLVGSVLVAADGLPPAATGPVDFETQVRPLFEQRCLACHGEANAMNGLRLDRRADALAGGHSGPAILPWDSASSRLVHMVAGYQVKVLMPPVGDPLTKSQVGLLRAWIDQGATWPESSAQAPAGGFTDNRTGHWAFQPVRRPEVPRGTHPVDHFVRRRLQHEGLELSPPADRATLLTRVSLDLTGLVPTVDERRAFVEDRSDSAYDQVVDRLIGSEHFGEKQAIHWLDQVRYADSDGYAKDYTRPHAWRYRRWVIDAINADMPFDRFSIEQIAGDLLSNATVEQRVATGFHRNTLRNREGGVNPAQFFFEETVDRASTFGTVWLGLTVGCAQCHDHKYDPISQREFYQIFAYFDNLEEAHIYAPLQGEMGPYLRTVNEYRRKHQEILDEYNVPELQAAWEEGCLKAGADPGVYLDWDLAWQELGLNTDGGQEIVRIPAAERTWRQANMVTYYFLRAYSLVVGAAKQKELGFPEALRKIKALNEQYPQRTEARVVHDRAEPKPTHLRVRGSWDRPGIEVRPSTPAFLPAGADAAPTRLELARWLFSDSNPLTARVAVNRIWQEYFGRGLVTTSDDFGTQGAEPSHPELLDWLASEFRDSGWNVKRIHRLIVTSDAYRQSAVLTPKLANRDPSNELLGRQTRLRLPAELIWDRALASAGLLHHDVGGPGFRPAMPEGTTGFKAGGTDWEPTIGREQFKRGMYIQFQRTQPYPFLTTFDSPEFRAPACSRERSNTPLQALNLLNDPTFSEAWRGLASRVLTEVPKRDFEDRLRHAYELTLGRRPSVGEQSRFAAYVSQRREESLASGDLSGLPTVDGLDKADLVAWTSVGRILMNLDEFVTRP